MLLAKCFMALAKYSVWQKDMPNEERARLVLYNSVMGCGDFARYIIGTNSGNFEWSKLPLDTKGVSRRIDESKTKDRFDVVNSRAPLINVPNAGSWVLR